MVNDTAIKIDKAQSRAPQLFPGRPGALTFSAPLSFSTFPSQIFDVFIDHAAEPVEPYRHAAVWLQNVSQVYPQQNNA